MKKLIIIFILFIPFISSQEIDLDMAYLESLPESVRDDVESELERKKTEKLDEDSYQVRPSTELLKSELIRDWELFQRQRDSLQNRSERYGINLFRTMQSTFMPINEPNFGNNYFLDFGDILEINLFGNTKNQTYELEIKRDGSIFLPELGSINIAGLSFENAIKKIKSNVKNSYVGVEVDISMSKARDIKILISGQIEFPGIYTLSGNSNVFQAINIAGGVKENGTLRDVEVKRNGEVIATIDFYDALLFGDISEINQLQSGDAIYVKPYNRLVRAGSGFENEALFELKENETISDLLKFSGGISKNVASIKYTLLRVNGSNIDTIEVNEQDINSYKLKHLDSIYLPITNYGSVKIHGEVKRPGNYTINSTDDILDIINRAGGYTEAAYQYGGILKTEKARKLEIEYIEKAYNNLIGFIVQNPTALKDGAAKDIGSILAEIKNIEPSGRVVAEFDLRRLEEDPLKRKILNDMDEIYIPNLDNVVYVYGEVNNPSALSFKDFKKPNEYISLAGGLTRFADSNYIYVVSPNGEANVINLGKLNNVLAVNSKDVYPGSLIFVPKKIGSVQGIQLYSTIAPIFSSLALSLASLNSIND